MTAQQFQDSKFDTSNFKNTKSFWGTNLVYLDDNTRIKEGKHSIEVSAGCYLLTPALILQKWKYFYWSDSAVILRETYKEGTFESIVFALLTEDDRSDLIDKLKRPD